LPIGIGLEAKGRAVGVNKEGIEKGWLSKPSSESGIRILPSAFSGWTMRLVLFPLVLASVMVVGTSPNALVAAMLLGLGAYVLVFAYRYACEPFEIDSTCVHIHRHLLKRVSIPISSIQLCVVNQRPNRIQIGLTNGQFLMYLTGLVPGRSRRDARTRHIGSILKSRFAESSILVLVTPQLREIPRIRADGSDIGLRESWIIPRPVEWVLHSVYVTLCGLAFLLSRSVV
jgi:hypothetical protein